MYTNISRKNTMNEVCINHSPNMAIEKFYDEEFNDWFRGFCDAESNFTIRIRKKENGDIRGFEFLFRISLHIDDLEILKKILNKLNCGKIIRDRNTYTYLIYTLRDIETIVIPLFNEWPLMTKKYLDFRDFKNSFYLFKKRQIQKVNREIYNLEILKLKSGMNDKRIDFFIPENHVKITANYLLGYIEGDGSF